MAVDFEALDLIRTQNKAEQYERQKYWQENNMKKV